MFLFVLISCSLVVLTTLRTYACFCLLSRPLLLVVGDVEPFNTEFALLDSFSDPAIYLFVHHVKDSTSNTRNKRVDSPRSRDEEI